MKRRGVSVFFATATCVAASSFSPTASAVEHEHHLGVDAGASLLVIGNKSTHDLGGAFGFHYSYGLSDAFNLIVEAGTSLLALNQTADNKNTPHTYPAWLSNADIGVAYVFDVLQWVPYAGLLLGGYGLSGGTLDGLKVLTGAEIVLGLDYRVGPHLAIGVTFRQHMLLSDTSTYPSFTQGLVRAETTWGW